MLRLKTLGGLAIESEAPLTGAATQRRPLALLALVASARRGCTRNDLLLYLWPDSTPERARNVLKQTLYALRRDLKAPDLFAGERELRLNPAVMSSDVAEFGEALERGECEPAVDLYRGPFLRGFHLKESPEFEQWREREQARLLRGFAGAIGFLADEAVRRGNSARAAGLWRRLAEADPLDAEAVLGLMETLSASGDPAGALQHAKVYEALVRQEPRRAPDPAVLEAAERIRSASRRSAPHATVPEEAARVPAEISPLEAAAPPGTGTTTRGRHTGAGAKSRSTIPGWLALAMVALAVLLATLVGPADGRHSRRLDPNLLVVGPYGVFDPELQLWREGLMDVLSRSLDGAGPLRTVAPTVAVIDWRGQPDPSSAAALGRKTGAGLALTGDLLRAGRDSVRVTATVVDVATGRVLCEVQREDELAHMDRLTDSLTLAILRELDQRLSLGISRQGAIGFTHSLDALKAFLQGEQYYRRAQWDSARASYQRALEEDGSFALALRRMGNVLSWERLTVDSLALSYLLRAGALNHGLSPRESLLVAADSLMAAANLSASPTAQWRLTRRLFATLENAVQRYPESPSAWLALGEARYHLGTGPGVGLPEQAVLGAFDRAIALDPAFGPAYIHPVELGFNLGGEALGLRYASAYLALDPTEPAHRGVRLVSRLIGREQLHGPERRRLLDTVGADALVSARTILRRWPDSAETAVLLSRLLAQGRPSGYPLFSDTSFMRRRLAQELAFRGHLRESYRVLGDRELPIFAELAYLGTVPEDTAESVFGRWVTARSQFARLALAWWSARRDTLALQRFRSQSLRLLHSPPNEDARLAAEYDTAAAYAHLFLSRGDTTRALARFVALPDTLCPDCYLDRLTRARLLAAVGRDREALRDLEEPLAAFLTPIEVLFAFERGKAAGRIGNAAESRRAYEFVVDCWQHGDPEIQARVAQARTALSGTLRRRA
jgi:serine/threonine-protein kinase